LDVAKLRRGDCNSRPRERAKRALIRHVSRSQGPVPGGCHRAAGGAHRAATAIRRCGRGAGPLVEMLTLVSCNVPPPLVIAPWVY
jgi:hypothetical protein